MWLAGGGLCRHTVAFKWTLTIDSGGNCSSTPAGNYLLYYRPSLPTDPYGF